MKAIQLVAATVCFMVPCTARVVAGKDGRWQAALSPMPASARPKDMIACCADKTQTIKNTLVGEAWVLSGQSNMEWAVKRSEDAEQEIPTANHPDIRFIWIPKAK